MGAVTTSPEPCWSCKGSGRVLDVRDNLQELAPHLRLWEGAGFYNRRCPVCFGHGEDREVPENPAFLLGPEEPDFPEPPLRWSLSGEITAG